MSSYYEVNPIVGEWEEQNVVYDFGDGWKVVEDKTEKDLFTLGKITKNCIGAGWYSKLLPAPENEAEVRERSIRAQWETPSNIELRGREWVEQMIAGALKVPTVRQYKILHLEDEERRPYAAIILGEKVAVEGGCTYASYRDLGQETCVELDGILFKLLQATWTTAWVPPVAFERLPIWWKEKSDGEWDEDAFQSKVDQYDRIYKPKPSLAYR